jgi:phosphate transport system substrate-binding protein
MLQIKVYEIAKVAGVVAVTNDVSVTNISSQQLCDIYSGKIKNWKQVGGKDSAILVMTRPESDSTKLRFRKSFACMANLQEPPDVVNLAKSAEMFTALQTKKSAIGIVDGIAMSDAAGKFKAIKIDGNGYEKHESGQWPYGLRNHLVVRRTENKEAVNMFLEFMKTAEVQSIIKKNKATPMLRK